jgi:hypothetical protein
MSEVVEAAMVAVVEEVMKGLEVVVCLEMVHLAALTG